MKTTTDIMNDSMIIKKEIDKILSKEESDRLWKKATARLAKIIEKYKDIPKGEHIHTDNAIFPSAAIYLTAKGYMSDEQAFAVIENAAVHESTAMNRKLVKAMKIPLMPDLFVKMWDPITRKMFGESSGFKNRFYPKKKGEYRMDILSCPYFRYFTELGCPELTRIFCENDERSYGNIPGLCFERSTTIGKGGDRCDFYIKRVK